MKPPKERSLFRTAYRFFIIGKFFGVSCFSIKKDTKNSKYTEVTRSDLMVLFGFFALFILLTYQNIAYPQSLSNDDQIFNYWTQFLIGGIPIICSAVIVKAFLDREKLWTVIFDLMSLDKCISRLGIVIDHSLYYRNVSIYLFVFYLAFFIYMSMFVACLIITTRASSIFYVIACVYVNGMVSVMLNQFHLILAVLYTRFTLLNEFVSYELNNFKHYKHIKDLIPRKTFNLTGTVAQQININSTSLLVTMAEVTRSHELLNAAAIKTNYLFSLHTLCATVATFGMTIFPIYEIFKIISSEGSQDIPLLLMSLVAGAVFHNSLIIIAVTLAHETKTSSDQTAVIVHKAVARVSDNAIILRLKLLSQQIMHQSPTFGCLLFTYDWPFVLSYIATMTSYLFILTQFQSTVDTTNTKS